MLDDYRIRKILELIEDDPSKSITELAHQMNLSSSRLGHLFRTQVGIDLDGFLRNARLEKAAELLRTTELSIKEIAAQVGYHHASSLDRGFKHKFALEPADYRKRHRDQADAWKVEGALLVARKHSAPGKRASRNGKNQQENGRRANRVEATKE
jgi:transcriptional regulator GlxA family with amidase domain